jgi:hypothetical protein
MGFDARSLADGKPVVAKEEKPSVELIPTFGPMGSKRPTTYIAGDLFCSTLKMSGLKSTKDGTIDAVTKFTLVDQKGHFVQDWGSLDACGFRPWFGESAYIVAFCSIFGEYEGHPIQLNTPPGKYRVRATTLDNVAGREVVGNLSITILPADTFGITKLRLVQGRQGREPAGPYMMAGHVAGVTFAIVNQTVVEDRAKVRVTVSVVDKDGQPVGKPDSGTFERKSDDSTNPRAPIPVGPPFRMSRPGRFTIELKVEDLLAKPVRTVTEKMPIVVVDPARE